MSDHPAGATQLPDPQPGDLRITLEGPADAVAGLRGWIVTRGSVVYAAETIRTAAGGLVCRMLLTPKD